MVLDVCGSKITCQYLDYAYGVLQPMVPGLLRNLRTTTNYYLMFVCLRYFKRSCCRFDNYIHLIFGLLSYITRKYNQLCTSTDQIMSIEWFNI